MGQLLCSRQCMPPGMTAVGCVVRTGNELNYFRQLYVESSGKPGDLRISEVYRGDPAVQGSIFVHERE